MYRKALLIVFALLNLTFLGCGGLTGGSVPPGNPGQARLVVTVVDEQNPSVPIATAEVEIVTEDGQVLTRQTDTAGQFEVQVPKGKKYIVRVKPPAVLSDAFQERATEVLVDEDEVRVVLPMLRLETVLPTVIQMLIKPEQVTLRVGESQTFQLKITPEPTMPLRPVWSVHGGIGVINADGVFTATHVGRGKVRVRLDDIRAEAQVTVLPVTPHDERE